MKRTPIAAALTLAALALTGCAQGEPQAAETVTATATVTATPSPTPSETDEPIDHETSTRGARVMRSGDYDGLYDADGTELLSFKVNSIEVDPKCVDGEVPENGHFVVFDAELEITPEAEGLLNTPSDMFNIAAYRVIDSQGNTLGSSPNTGPAHGCLPEGEMIKYDIGPGEKTSGKVVFDVATDSGVLLHHYENTDLKWEWAF